MPLSTGTRLGSYEIVGALGAGGMGEVYRARDTKLGRTVAVKVLPEALASDSDRIARFEREAKVLASLNHAHIAALHGLEEDGGRHFLVMELVEGETIAERLQRGPIRVPASARNYDVTPDGRIVGVVVAGVTRSGRPAPPQIQVVLNWFEDLKQRTSVK